jgi:hypothetical protein
MWFNLIHCKVSSKLYTHCPTPKHDIHTLMLSLHHHECLECWFRCVLDSSSPHTVCSYKHCHHTCCQHWQWCLLIHPCLSIIYSFIFSSLSWNIYHLPTLVKQMSPYYYTSFNLLFHLSQYTVSPSPCCRHLVYAILIMYIFHAIASYTHICFQLTTQHRVLMLFTCFGHKPQPFSESYSTSSPMQRVTQPVSHKWWIIYMWCHCIITVCSFMEHTLGI